MASRVGLAVVGACVGTGVGMNVEEWTPLTSAAPIPVAAKWRWVGGASDIARRVPEVHAAWPVKPEASAWIALVRPPVVSATLNCAST